MRVTKLRAFDKGTEMSALSYEPDRIIVSFETNGQLIFEDVVGFRVLDESDLLEFWPLCSAPHGALFAIEEGGWHSQESMRSGFLTAVMELPVKEFLVTGDNFCLSVLAFTSPNIETLR